MAVAGRKPKPDGERRNRMPAVHDWAEVADTPYAGEVPQLPDREPAWPVATRRWWGVVSRMPHCVLWAPSDWEYALETAEVHARFTEGVTNGTELRIRQKLLGTTLDARRDLRIRYVQARPEEPAAGDATVTSLDEYRDL